MGLNSIWLAGVLIQRRDSETHTQRVHRVKMETEIGVRLLQPRNTADPQQPCGHRGLRLLLAGT